MERKPSPTRRMTIRLTGGRDACGTAILDPVWVGRQYSAAHGFEVDCPVSSLSVAIQMHCPSV